MPNAVPYRVNVAQRARAAELGHTLARGVLRLSGDAHMGDPRARARARRILATALSHVRAGRRMPPKLAVAAAMLVRALQTGQGSREAYLPSPGDVGASSRRAQLRLRLSPRHAKLLSRLRAIRRAAGIRVR
ncbi:MAG TPA: hypothetical protein VFX49_11825 [Chloroflexota bacterium]|nr:hypothetical protein [Chloroflexota bacterium]